MEETQKALLPGNRQRGLMINRQSGSPWWSGRLPVKLEIQEAGESAVGASVEANRDRRLVQRYITRPTGSLRWEPTGLGKAGREGRESGRRLDEIRVFFRLEINEPAIVSSSEARLMMRSLRIRDLRICGLGSTTGRSRKIVRP